MKSERQEQKSYLKWLADHHPVVRDMTFAVPNGADLGGSRKAAIQINSLRAQGMSNGCPDLFIMYPKGEYHGAAIEMKTEDGGKVSDAQLEWREKLLAQGYAHGICNGADAAITFTTMYLEQ